MTSHQPGGGTANSEIKCNSVFAICLYCTPTFRMIKFKIQFKNAASLLSCSSSMVSQILQHYTFSYKYSLITQLLVSIILCNKQLPNLNLLFIYFLFHSYFGLVWLYSIELSSDWLLVFLPVLYNQTTPVAVWPYIISYPVSITQFHCLLNTYLLSCPI